MPGQDFKLLVEHARQVVQVARCGESALAGKAMQDLSVLEGMDGGYSILVDSDGKIADIGPSADLEHKYDKARIDHVLDATGQCVIPGFVDAHTHPVWAGDRVHEFAMKLAGASYMDIHQLGGGIHFTVRHTREASEDTLYHSLTSRLREMARCGTTLVECKSGYGLDQENEIKMLRVIERARRGGQIDISTTYCGAHAVPKGMTAEEATQDVITKQIPEIEKLMRSNEIHVDNIDVFCEKGVFDLDQSRDILLAGQRAGLQLNFHGEELHRLHSAEMGATLGAQAISHLEEVSDQGVKAMAESGTVAVILPTTAYNLRLSPPPVRAMIEAGVFVALGTDFNPNAYCLAMPVVMNLACITMKMSMCEALVAATLNGAHALGQSQHHGSLEHGKWANMVLVDAPSWEHVIYQMGSHNSIISAVIHRGEVRHTRS